MSHPLLLWRVGVGLLVAGLVGLPVGELLVELLSHPSAWRVWGEWPRLLGLARNSLGLAGCTLLLAWPVGVIGAVLLYRSDLPGRSWLRTLTVWSLFVPLPVLASAWQAALGAGGWWPMALWRTVTADDPAWSPAGALWKPWARGLGPAIWVHAMAATPWVVWLVGLGLSHVERDLEDDARTVAGPWVVLTRVTFRRALPALFAAGVLVVAQAVTEMPVADLFLVRTYAEEVNIQYAAPERDPEAVDGRDVQGRALAVTVPPALGLMAVVGVALWGLGRRIPPPEASPSPPLIRLGPWRWPALVGVLIVVAVLVGVPIVGLFWRTGLDGGSWSMSTVGWRLAETVRVHTALLGMSLGGAVVTGAGTAALALLVCWLFGRDRRGAVVVLGIAALLWALPGPVVGVALKEAIDRLIDIEAMFGMRQGVLRRWLWDGPSPLPVWWAAGLRFFPVALAVIWPAMRHLPDSLIDAVRVDSGRGRHELLWVVWPMARGAVTRAALAVAVLSLGELSAGKLVETPGGQTFAREVFAQLHYGVGGELSALCLVQLTMTVLPAWVLGRGR